MYLSSIIYFAVVAPYLFYCLVGRREFTPNSLYLLFQLVMFTGLLSYVQPNSAVDQIYLWVYLVAAASFIVFSEVSRFYSRKRIRVVTAKGNSLSESQFQMIWLIVGASLLVCVYYFATSGANVFIMSLKSFFSGSTQNFTELRLQNNGASGVGYVYQFRVILLPLLVLYMAFSKNKRLTKWGLVLTPVMLTFLLGTGQRGGFVLAMLGLVISLLYINTFYKAKLGKYIFAFCGIAFLLFMLMTIFNGRVLEGQNVFQAVLSRVFDSNQESAIYAFRYIYTQPCQWGYDWAMSVLDILPGKNSHLDLSYIVFEIMYGSTRGTAPPCIWGSVFYNFNWIGIIIFPALIAFFLDYLYVRLLRMPLSYLRIFVYSSMYVSLGSWVAGGIMSLFNQGFVTLVILAILMNLDNPSTLKRREENSDQQAQKSLASSQIRKTGIWGDGRGQSARKRKHY